MPSRHSPSGSTPLQLLAYTDGGSRGNPGPAGYGVVLQELSGKAVGTLSGFLGTTTNNVAEYHALLAALEYAVEKKAARLQVFSDSELMVRQMQGRYKVQSADLQPLYRRALELAATIGDFSIRHVPREQNREADRLANAAMDRGRTTPAPPVLSFWAVAENGRLKPVERVPELEDGAEYEVKARRKPRS